MSYSLRALLYIVLICLLPTISRGVVANFTVDRTSGCVPLIVHFTNTSTAATGYSWDFGNSSTSTLANPSGSSYLAAGTYTVTLTAFNGPSSSTHSVVITVYPLPVAGFSTTDTAVCPGVPVAFTNTSAAGMAGSMTYSWNFGDGATSTLATPSHSYASPGFYSVTLYATNSGGCTNSITRTNYVHVFTKPVANFSTPSPNACMPPATMPFSNSSTGTAPLSYAWTFGDGATSTTTAPSRTYTLSGSYTVKLVVTNGNGCKDSLTRPSYVNVGSLPVSFAADTTVCVDKPLTFTNTSSPHISSLWRFGDGGTSTNENPIYTYGTPGIYTIKLIISNGICSDSTSRSITVYPKPVVGYSVSPAQPCPPPITQTFTATMPAGSTASWTFGDGGTGTGSPATHNFTVPQITPVGLTVVDVHGCVNTAQKLDTLNSLTLSVSANANQGCIPLSVNFNTTKFSVVLNRISGMTDVFTYPYPMPSYNWSFGDGSPNSTSATPSHVYTATGSYVINCTIVTANGCTKSASYVVKAGTPPVASFTATPTHVCAHKPVVFTSTSTGGANSYTWDFGDGESAGTTSTTISHSFSAPGNYSVTLNALFNGCPATTSFSLPILVDSPGSLPSYYYICTPLNGVQFYDFSTGATSRLWLFGDGDTSSLANPAHYYPSLSMYNVRLATYNSTTGCRDTSSGFLVDLNPIDFSFAATDTTVCLMQLDTFLANPGFGGPIFDYRWAIDGTTIGGNSDSLFYSFPTPGYHTIRLAIIDNRGCKDTLIKSNYVHVANPLAHFTSTPIAGCAPLTVALADGSTDDPGITLSSYFWQFGDGDSTSLTSPTTTHTYTTAGSYYVLERVTDSFGCTDTTIGLPITVYKPTPGFSSATTSVCANVPVHFSNSSSDTSSAFWIFGDGATSTVISPNHVYTAAGTYTVRLVAYDSHGCSDTLTFPSYITVNPLPVAGFTMNDTFAVCPPLNVAFTNISTGASSYNWTFGDGASSVIANPGNPYTAPGFYPIILVATNSFGCTDTATSGATVFGYTGAFTYTPTSGCSPLPVHFNVTLGSVSSVVWDFSDGYVSSASLSDTISHIYTTPGRYVPKLILTDTTGCTNFSFGADTIKVNAVVPSFTMTPTQSCVNNTVSFGDSSYSFFSTPTSWAWSFGSGATSTSATPSYTYTTAGVHTVSLTTTDGWGCTGTVIKSVTVNPLPATLTGNHTLCVGYTTTLATASSGGTWYSGATGIATISSTGVISGIAAGTANITYTLPTGCQTSTVVTVYSLPAAIAGPTNICHGATATLSSATPGGTWTSGVPGVVSIASTGEINGVSLGSATITYTAGTGCFVTQLVSVSALPAPVTGPSTVCDGSTITLSSASSGVTWSSSDPSVAFITSTGLVVATMPGSVTIYCGLVGCFRTFDVTVNPLPAAITGTMEVCEGLTTILSDATPGGTWSSGFPGIAAITSTGVVTGVMASLSTITYTLPTSCKTTAEVTVNPLPDHITGTLDICLGAVVIMSSTTPFGTWSSSNTSVATINPVTGAVSAVSVGTTTITYTLPTGCITTKEATVNATPPVTTGSHTVCAGFMSNLANPMPGGIWSSSPPATIATIHPLTGVVTGISPGTVTVSYTVLSGCVATSVVTVNPLPPPITGVPRVCVGGITTLADAAPGGTWESSNIGVATAAPLGLISGVATGTATVTYTIPTGCINILEVTVNPLPLHITGPNSVCEGGSVTFSNATSGGAWTSNNVSIATVGLLSGIVTGMNAGNTLISYTIPATGCYTTKPITVNPTPAGIAGVTSVCIGTPSTLYSSLSGGTWSSSNPAIATVGGSTGIVTGLITGGAFTVTYTLPIGGCQAVKHMTVNTLPPTHNVTGGGSYCAGGNGVHIGLDGSDIGVSYALYYGSSATGYVAGTGSTLDFGLLTVAGLYTVQATDANTGCHRNMGGSAIVTITPNALPTVTIAGPAHDTVCPGIVTTFLPHPTNGGIAPTYQWKVNGLPVGSGSSYSFLPAAGDVITVKMTSNGTCVSPDTAISSLTIISIPNGMPSVSVAIDPGDTVCEFTSTTFTATSTYGGAGAAYAWYINGASAGTGSALSYMPDNGDQVRCRVTSDYTCRLADTASSSAITMMVEPMLVPHVTVSANPGLLVSPGQIVTLTATVADAGPHPAYQWYVNGIPVPAATSTTYVSNFNDYDSVTCKVTSSGTCPDISSFDWVFISVKPLGVSTVSSTNTIGLIPNPSNGTFTIKGNLAAAIDQPVELEIVDMLGQKLLCRRIDARKGRINELVELPETTANGMYLLKVTSNNESEAFHVIINR